MPIDGNEDLGLQSVSWMIGNSKHICCDIENPWQGQNKTENQPDNPLSEPMVIQESQSISSTQCTRRGIRALAIWFLGLVGVSFMIAYLDLDRYIAALFYQRELGWFMRESEPWAFLYQYGTIPGLILAVSALSVWIGSYFSKRLLPVRRESLLVVLTVVIAAGILVNAVLKQYWGRPRPSQIVEFGGQWQYRHIFPPGTPGKGGSFPCGHCAMGFAFLSLVGFYPRSKRIAFAGGLAGIMLGGMLSAARIIQGAHFLSDVIWSMGIVAMVAILLHYMVLRIPMPVDVKRVTQKTTTQKTAMITATVIAVMVMAIAFMTRRPYYRTFPVLVRLEQATASLLIYTNTDPERVQVHYDDARPGRIEIHSHGFGWMDQDHRIRAEHVNKGPRQIWAIRADARSYFAELYYAIDIYLPHSARHRLTVDVKKNQTISDLDKALMLNTDTAHP